MTEEDVQKLYAQFQGYQQQLQNIIIQKESMKLQEIEVDKALEELNKTNQKNAYKMTGQVMVSKTVDELKKELGEAKEDIQLRLKSLENTETRIESKLKEIQTKLKEMK